MKKKILLFVLCLLLTSSVFAIIKGLSFKPAPFNEDAYMIGIYDFMVQQEAINVDSQSYDFAFKDKDGKFEIRYIMFSETEPITDFIQQVNMWSFMVIQNIAGDEKTVGNTTAFTDSDVKNEFNADYGLTSFIKNGVSDYCPEYPYNMISFFYKKGIGLMCQTISFSDTSILQTQKFIDVFHTFKFY